MNNSKKVYLLHPADGELLTQSPAEFEKIPTSVRNSIPTTWKYTPDPILGMVPQSYMDPDLDGMAQSLIDSKIEHVAEVVIDTVAVPKVMAPEKPAPKPKQKLTFPKPRGV